MYMRINIHFLGIGAGYGTAKSGVGIMSMGVMRPELVMRALLPVVMAGIIGIYGLIVDMVLLGYCTLPLFSSLSIVQKSYPLFTGALHLAAGLCVGLSGLAAGVAIGIVGDAGVRATAQQPRLFVGMVIILIFAEVLGLYGLIISLIINSKATADMTC